MSSILLVEDDPFLIEVYSTKLKEEEFEVRVAKTGLECIERIKEEKPDLVLLDIVLPNLNGWEILRKLQNENILEGLKVVILSNLGQKEEVEKGIGLGAVSYLIKAHHTPTEVVREVKKILKS